MSEIDVDAIADQIRESGALDSQPVGIPVNIEPTASEPDYSNLDQDDIDNLSPSELEKAYEQDLAARKASPAGQRRDAATKAREQDEKIGRQIREHVQQEEIAAEVERTLDSFSQVIMDDENQEWFRYDDSEGESYATEKTIAWVGKALEKGVPREALIEVLDEDMFEEIEAALQAGAAHELTEAATAAYGGVDAGFDYYHPLGQNHVYTDRAHEIANELLQSGAVDLVGLSEAAGKEFTLSCYRIAHEEEAAREDAEGRFYNAVAQASGGRADGREPDGKRWFFEEYMPSLPEPEQERIWETLQPKEVDPRRLFAPLSIPLDEAIANNDQKVIKAHGLAEGKRIQAMASQVFGTTIPLDTSGLSDKWDKAMSAENRRLNAERTTPKARDEVDIESELRSVRRAGDKSAKQAAMKRARAGGR